MNKHCACSPSSQLNTLQIYWLHSDCQCWFLLIFEDMKKSTTTSIHWIYSVHAHLPSNLFPERGYLCGHWRHSDSADLCIAHVGDMKKKQWPDWSIEYTVCMLTFFASSHQNVAISLSLKVFVSAIMDDAVLVSADLNRTNIGVMEKINNHINPMNMQYACSPFL